MAMDIGQVAAATVVAVGPYLPYLIEVGKAAGKKLAEVIAEKGGEAAWKRAQEAWKRITERLGGDAKVKGAAMVVASDPEDEEGRKMLARVLVERFRANAELAEELAGILGPDLAQSVSAEKGAWVEDVLEYAKGAGRQEVKAKGKGTVVRRVTQIRE